VLAPCEMSYPSPRTTQTAQRLESSSDHNASPIHQPAQVHCYSPMRYLRVFAAVPVRIVRLASHLKLQTCRADWCYLPPPVFFFGQLMILRAYSPVFLKHFCQVIDYTAYGPSLLSELFSNPGPVFFAAATKNAATVLPQCRVAWL